MNRIEDYLLGLNHDPMGLDVNGDKKVDVADLVRAGQVQPPRAPWAPDPVNYKSGVPVNTALHWLSDQRAVSYDLYLWPPGADQPTTATARALTSTVYQPPGALTYKTQYQWRVVAHGQGSDTGGPVWSFTTLSNP